MHRVWSFGKYTYEIEIVSVGHVEKKWRKEDGSIQKTEPSSVKKNFVSELKEMKNTIKQIETMTTVQRDRVDLMFRSNRYMKIEHFKKYYFNHPLMALFGRNLIWTFHFDDKVESAIFVQDKWLNENGKSVDIKEAREVSLWHPVFSDVKGIENWRAFIIDEKIKQPLKQAFRELYILTEAELRTKSYSNRMAAHILKQHQFSTLAKIRGWHYSLLGAYDDGRDGEVASLNIPAFSIRAEYWINGLASDDNFNEAGIWNYVATDQVRFVNIATNEVIDLSDVPAIVLSEVMRDCDLFVGVSSVGNDPMWRDSGNTPGQREYWQAYSFGDLSEIAKTRKSILEKLLPKLKIASMSQIKDKFLVVKGKLRTYKIHIGSTNILMEPNDEYLCIVPDRSQKDITSGLFIPFDTDSALSVIISKAFLLFDDDKITDETIIRQIKRK